ncbi:hypothetical protein ES703_28285 [subsurface metagenome]
MVTVKKFTIGHINDLKSEGYKWQKAGSDREKILGDAEDYDDAVVVHNTETGMFTIYAKGERKLGIAKLGKYRVEGVVLTDDKVVVTPYYGEPIVFKDITRYPVQAEPPLKEEITEREQITEREEITEKVEPQLTTPAVEVGGPSLQYQAKVTGEGPAYWKFGGKEEKKKKKKPVAPGGEAFYKTLEPTDNPKSDEQTDVVEFVAWMFLGGGGSLGILNAMDRRANIPQQRV